MQICNLTGEILTPIHIGSGDELEPYDYLIKDNRFFKINLSDFILNLSAEDQAEFNDLVATDLVRLRQFNKEKVDTDKFSEYSADVSEAVVKLYQEKVDIPENRLIIAPFIRDLNRPFLPGSSLKGAIRTAVIYYLFNGKFKGRERRSDIFEANLLQSQRGFFDKRAKQWVTRGLDQAKEPFRAIKIADTYLSEHATQIEKIDTITKKETGFHTLNMQIIREVTHSSFTGNTVNLNIEMRLDDQLLKKNKNIRQKIDIDFLVTSANTYANDIIQSELRYFTENHPTTEIYNQLQSIELEDNECLLRVGWGSGFDSVTVNLKRENPKYVKTRKLIRECFPLGWIKLKYISK